MGNINVWFEDGTMTCNNVCGCAKKKDLKGMEQNFGVCIDVGRWE
jgi:hypothetical protein